MTELSQADLFPLIRGGGLFLIVAGLAIVAGAFAFRARYPIFGLGAAIGGALTALYAAPLAAPYGKPDMLQLASLAGAVALEMAFLVTVLRAQRTVGERDTMLGILTVVGGHFVLMAPAFGPIVLALAGASVLNVLLALLWRGYPDPLVWAVDGVLKAVAGAMMFMGHELPCTMCVRWTLT
jgi:hypothetical protein